MGSPKNSVVIIDTSNFEKLESHTIWLIEVEKVTALISYHWHLDFKPIFCCDFGNALDISSSMNEVATFKVSILYTEEGEVYYH